MQQLINVQTVIKSAALASALGAIAIPRALSYARRVEPVRKMMEGAEKRGEGYEGWRWIWEVLKMSTVRRQGASGAAGLRRVGLGEKFKAQVLRWRDWKARGWGRQRRVLLAEYLTSRKKAGKERWSGGVLGRGFTWISCKRGKYHVWIMKHFRGLPLFLSQMCAPGLCKFNTVSITANTKWWMERRGIKMRSFCLPISCYILLGCTSTHILIKTHLKSRQQWITNAAP